MVERGGQKLTTVHLVLLLLKIVEGSGVEGPRARAGLKDLACHQLLVLDDRKTCRGSCCVAGAGAPVLAPRPMASNRLLALLLGPGLAVRPGEGLSELA